MAKKHDARRAWTARRATAGVPPTGRTSDAATTRSPADRDIFGDDGATRPAKDREHPPRQPSSEAGGVD
jgi:hypothetical protein